VDSATLEREYAAFLDDRLKLYAARLVFSGSEDADAHPVDKSSLMASLRNNPDDFFANLRLGIQLRQEKANREASNISSKPQACFPSSLAPEIPTRFSVKCMLRKSARMKD